MDGWPAPRAHRREGLSLQGTSLLGTSEEGRDGGLETAAQFRHCRLVDERFGFRKRSVFSILPCVVRVLIWETRYFGLIEFLDDVLASPHEAFCARDQFDGVTLIVMKHCLRLKRLLSELNTKNMSKYVAAQMRYS
jgi:hypothetical protein